MFLCDFFFLIFQGLLFILHNNSYKPTDWCSWTAESSMFFNCCFSSQRHYRACRLWRAWSRKTVNLSSGTKSDCWKVNNVWCLSVNVHTWPLRDDEVIQSCHSQVMYVPVFFNVLLTCLFILLLFFLSVVWMSFTTSEMNNPLQPLLDSAKPKMVLLFDNNITI